MASDIPGRRDPVNATNPNGFQSVLITGGGGYVGSALTPRLLDLGYHVRVVDTFWYGRNVFVTHDRHPRLELIELDLRHTAAFARHLRDVDVVIHLACISNDPSFELNRQLGQSINYDCFPELLQSAIDAGVKRFIYASSSSIYGVKDDPEVREDVEPEPLTDYSRFKLACEHLLLEHPNPHDMERVILRPATVCGYAPRLRLDLVVNILTIHALVEKRIKVFGGGQKRPNLPMPDMVDTYLALLEADGKKVDGEAFNAGLENHTVSTLALLIRDTLGDSGITIVTEPSNDNRSYHICSAKIRDRLGVQPRHTIADAVRSLADAYRAGLIHDPLKNPLYYNIRTMQRREVA
jgi:nucleoside-diphosphate-sugar epimerase